MSGPSISGFTATVIKPAQTPEGRAEQVSGIGATATFDSAGTPILAITIRHLDGTMVSAMLCEKGVHRLAEMMADFVEALPAIRSEARH
jgi:hypothetical protein